MTFHHALFTNNFRRWNKIHRHQPGIWEDGIGYSDGIDCLLSIHKEN
jgi:hypothetical protein